MPQTASLIDRAGGWFLHSGIQEPSGGVARYYRSDLGRNARVSTEITGYAASAFAFLYTETGEERYREAARRAAGFLARTAWESSLRIFPFEYAADGEAPENLAYFFDSGIIARGLVAVWRATGEAEWLEAAVETARSMARDFSGPGCFHPVLLLPSKRPAPWAGGWSRRPGCYQLKSAMGWLTVDAATGRADFTPHYERALEMALSNDAEFLPGDPDPARVMDRLHAYSYFLEGLLPRAGRAECARALAAGIPRAAALLGEIAPAFERSDVPAQLLRVRLLADALGAVKLDEAAAREEAHRAASFELGGDDPRLRHGFCFGRKQGQWMPFANPVSTAFCVQALEAWRAWQAGRFQPDLDALI